MQSECPSCVLAILLKLQFSVSRLDYREAQREGNGRKRMVSDCIFFLLQSFRSCSALLVTLTFKSMHQCQKILVSGFKYCSVKVKLQCPVDLRY